MNKPQAQDQVGSSGPIPNLRLGPSRESLEIVRRLEPETLGEVVRWENLPPTSRKDGDIRQE